MRGEQKSEDREQGPRRILGSDVKVSKTPLRRECAEKRESPGGAGGHREGTAEGPGTGWDGEGLEWSGGGGAKAMQGEG